MDDTQVSYSLSAIRELLLAAFTPQELRRFCMYHPPFRPIVDRFGPGYGFDDMVDEVVEYCERNVLLSDLLKAIAKKNPRQYERFCQLSRPAVEEGIWPKLEYATRPVILSSHFRTGFPDNKDLVGREPELACLHRALMEEQSGRRRPVGLTGMGGIGKTLLAAGYARRNQDAYPGGVFAVDATNEQDWAEQLVKQADWLGLSPADSSDPDRTKQMIMALSRYFSEYPGSLILFDNVPDPCHLMNPSLGAGISAAELGALVLFTTRQRDWPEEGMVKLDVPLLPLSFARTMIVDARPEAATDPALDELCRVLGNLPLALTLAAAALRNRPRMTLSSYLKKLGELGAEKVHRKAGVTAPGLARALTAQWKMLSSQNARLVLRAAAELGDTSLIPITWLELLTGLQDDKEGLDEPLRDAVTKLWGVSLVERMGDDHIRLHSLVRDFAQKVGPGGRSAFRSTLESHVVVVLQDPACSTQTVLTAGECLLHVPWKPIEMRTGVLKALSRLITETHVPVAERQAGAFLLERLRWLEDVAVLSPGALLAYLDLIERPIYIYQRDEWTHIVHAIASLLACPLSERDRAYLLGYQAIFLAKLGMLEEAEEGYQEAQQFFDGLDAAEKWLKDHQLDARVKLGRANILVFRAMSALDAGRDVSDLDLQGAIALYRAAAEKAGNYQQDVALMVGIYTELSHVLGLAESWDEAEEFSHKAIDLLNREQNLDAWVDCSALIRQNAGLMHWAKGNDLVAKGRASDALDEFTKAYEHACVAIGIVDNLFDPKDSAEAHLNAGDYLLAMSEVDAGSEAQHLAEACAEWKRAVEKARGKGLEGVDPDAWRAWRNGLDEPYRLALEGLEKMACERLIQHCPSEAPEGCMELLKEE
ncbi:MAG: hypothetical protein JXM73_24055 [Anaerolineae bacterium]|nr:hypothetical protein [Anaerolineae bacterium]